MFLVLAAASSPNRFFPLLANLSDTLSYWDVVALHAARNSLVNPLELCLWQLKAWKGITEPPVSLYAMGKFTETFSAGL